MLGHSSSWLELEVHWTSSRKIGPLPAPKWALYALRPIHVDLSNTQIMHSIKTFNRIDQKVEQLVLPLPLNSL